jgi:hypothetical protein
VRRIVSTTAEGAPMLDLRREAKELGPLRLPDVALTPDERAAVVTTWRTRMVAEYVSARVFAGLVPQAMAAGLRPRETAELLTMANEELSHGARCARVLTSLGEPAVAPMCELPTVPVHPGVSPLEGLVWNLLDVCCVSETAAVVLVGEEVERAGAPELAEELRIILADEVGHARFGFRVLGEVVPTFGPAERTRLSAYAATSFRERLVRFGAFLETERPSERVMAYGAPEGPSTFNAFVETLEAVVVPRLEEIGVPARTALRVAVGDLERRASAA